VDERLIAADPREVMRRIAEAYLAAPAITAEQGGIRLAPHQVEAAARLLALLGRWGGGVLADATGMGKTFVAISVARIMTPVLIVAPAALRQMWREALRRTGVDARIESYEALSRGQTMVVERPALLVLDEAHHARNPRSKRYAALADLAWGARVLLLTATPIHNRGRDLRALVALFMGSRADTLSEDELRHVIVRRTAGSWVGVAADSASALPAIAEPRWLDVPTDRDTLRAIAALPPAVPAADGAAAHALLLLGLIRAWSSSEAALRATLRRRLQRAAAMEGALESGRLPDRRELAYWPVVDDAIQLGFPELMVRGDSGVDVPRIRAAIQRHTEGVRAILGCLDRNDGAADKARIRLLASVRERHPSTPLVAFTQFADTAAATFRAGLPDGGGALVTGTGARIASGRVTVEEIVRALDIGDLASATPAAMPLHWLIATDVLSEGLSLRRAGVIVHLDLPWTIARLEQRVGRLRRFGSPHRLIAVYAIGPPVAARELVPVVRALQRKARLSSSVGGVDELKSALPLLGNRLAKATASVAQRGESQAIEELRQALSLWTDRTSPHRRVDAKPGPEHCVAIALVGDGTNRRLLAFSDDSLSDRPADVLRVVRMCSSRCGPIAQPGPDENVPDALLAVSAAVEKWLSEERGREIAKPATEASSASHVAVLRALQERLMSSTRLERASLARRIDRCRRLVMSAKGIGAELALARVLDSKASIDLDALEALLESRASRRDTQPGPARLLAMLCVCPHHAREARAFVGGAPER